jgi:hypothetical protein
MVIPYKHHRIAAQEKIPVNKIQCSDNLKISKWVLRTSKDSLSRISGSTYATHEIKERSRFWKPIGEDPLPHKDFAIQVVTGPQMLTARA